MKVHLAWITPKPGRSKEPEIATLLGRYIKRIRTYSEVTTLEAAGEKQLFEQMERLAGRTAPSIFLLDRNGEPWSSEEWAERIRRCRDGSVQHLALAIGPPDGWSAEARKRATKLVSLGPMTLPHELARMVMAEQVYRAFSILAGHPYHCGHKG